MNHLEVGKYWDDNADTWTLLARLGADHWRNLVNAPAFQAMLPDITGLHGLDIGCGEGYNTRLTVVRAARMTALDISPKFVRYAENEAQRTSLPISHLRASAVTLPFPDNTFDFAIATMSIMDCADQETAVREAFRVIRKGGFFQFSIVHPVFNGTEGNWLKNDEGKKAGYIVRDYYNLKRDWVEEWRFSKAPEEYRHLPWFKVPRFDRTLSGWINLVAESGFVIEETAEPTVTSEVRDKFEGYTDSGLTPFSFVIRGRKR